jgi:hypothetical protein
MFIIFANQSIDCSGTKSSIIAKSDIDLLGKRYNLRVEHREVFNWGS